MEENITHFDVCVWDDDVFINGEDISYWGGDERKGLQCNHASDADTYMEIDKTCEGLREQLIKLRNLLKE